MPKPRRALLGWSTMLAPLLAMLPLGHAADPVPAVPKAAPIAETPSPTQQAAETPTSGFIEVAPGIFRRVESVEPMPETEEGSPAAATPAGSAEAGEEEMSEGKGRQRLEGLRFQPSLQANEVVGSTLETRTEARTFTLDIPGPRGLILDRHGYPLAQNRVAYYAAINFPPMKDASEREILYYARERMQRVNAFFGESWNLDDEDILEHFQNRRWLPLTFTGHFSQAEADRLQPLLGPGLMLHPVYLRHYPHGAMAPHILGYVGKRPPRKTGPIEADESLWGEGEGVEGLEEAYNTQLTGKPGTINLVFEADGTRVREDIVVRPRPGQNVVTTLDLEIQMLAEEILAEMSKRGAFVILDVRTGDILAMASWPHFDPNDFVPVISHEKFSKLNNDPEKPLFARAFRSAYPPASTFKVPVALAALESGTVTMDSTYSCPTSYWVGDRMFHNWNKDPEGSMNVVRALARSCNTWFYQAGLATRAQPMYNTALMLGFGKKTGLPFSAEAQGFVPTDRWSEEMYGYPLLDGDIANMCIGQGTVLSSPLQVARAMAAIGSRKRVMEPRLVKQVQDVNNRVTETYPPKMDRWLTVDPYNLEVVVKGMEDVVNGGGGTGRRAGHPEFTVAGKTGTGQWKIAYEQNIAWFAGFAPAEAPAFAFAVVYEGDPGEKVGGGRNGAPMIGAFFERYFEDEARLTAFVEETERLELAAINAGRPEIQSGSASIFKGGDVVDNSETAPAAAAPEPKKKTGGGLVGWLKRFRGR